MRIVELHYNPYLPQLRILIDGRCLSDYSKLVQYTDEDIWYWQDKLLKDLYSELREVFSIRFIGRDCDAEIMAFQCEKDQNCVEFRALHPECDISLQTRLGKLNQILIRREERRFLRKNIFARFIIWTGVHLDEEEICSLDIKNEFCCVYPEIIEKITLFEDGEENYLFVIADTLEHAEAVLQNRKYTNPVFILVEGKETRLIGVNESGYEYETEKGFLISSILNCFLTCPLVQALRICYTSLPKAVKEDVEIQKLVMEQPYLQVVLDEIIEVGKRHLINLITETGESSFQRVEFRIQNEDIATVTGKYVYGKVPGFTLLEVYRYGEKAPFFVKKIQIIKRNRIKKLIMNENDIVLGEGDQKRLGVEYFPKDADNKSTISWKSTDASVAAIGNNGIVRAVGVGMCRIVCSAENVTTESLCCVKPYLKNIEFDVLLDENSVLQMKTGDEIPLHIRIIPEKCVDGKLRIQSSNPDIVNVANGILYGKNPGMATVKVSNGRITRELVVQVVELIKEEQKEKKEGRKRGFMKRLFGE